MVVNIKLSSFKEIIKHAEDGYPHEVCGVLIGTENNISEYKKCRNLNSERAHDRYELDPLSFKEADDYARSKGLEIIGIYHSHPDHPSRPSEFDRERAWHNWHYIIVSINRGKHNDSRSWLLNGNGSQFNEEIIEITDK